MRGLVQIHLAVLLIGLPAGAALAAMVKALHDAMAGHPVLARAMATR